jgi:hypothetical protein
LALGFGRVAEAGCDFGHGNQSSRMTSASQMRGYARHFRVLGQWVYEGGQVKYVAWQAEGECHGPYCSANRLPPAETGGMTLPQSSRGPVNIIYLGVPTYSLAPSSSDSIILHDAEALHGYPPAYEYPP